MYPKSALARQLHLLTPCLRDILVQYMCHPPSITARRWNCRKQFSRNRVTHRAKKVLLDLLALHSLHALVRGVGCQKTSFYQMSLRVRPVMQSGGLGISVKCVCVCLTESTRERKNATTSTKNLTYQPWWFYRYAEGTTIATRYHPPQALLNVLLCDESVLRVSEHLKTILPIFIGKPEFQNAFWTSHKALGA